MAYVVKNKIAFLAEASKILSSSLNYNVTLSSVANLVVSNVADFCMIDILEKRKIKRVIVKTADPKKQKLADKFYDFPPDPRNKRAIYDAAKVGHAIIIKKTTDGWLKTVSRIPEEKNTVVDLGLRSFIFAPLKSRNKVIGVLTIGSSKKGFSYKEGDAVFMEELAGRAGSAVDKARLFSETQEAIKTRDLFISLAAHELRTPITSAYVYLQLIERNYSQNKPFDPKWVITLMNEMERLSAIINEFLDVSQIRSGKLSYSWQECNIEKVVQSAVVDIRTKYGEVKIKVVSRVPIRNQIIIGDFNKLISVVINLLDNAIRHSKPGEEVKVDLTKNKKFLILKVKDKGAGINKHDFNKIFNDFYKAEDNTKPGMGLGLFLAKQIIEKHKGSIVLESEMDKGTTVKVHLPIFQHSKQR